MNKLIVSEEMGLSSLTENELFDIDGGNLPYIFTYISSWLSDPIGAGAWEMPPGV